MLKTINRFDKRESKYECDRCKANIDMHNRYSVYIGEGSANAKKKWDLCKRCYKALVRGIEKSK